MATERILSERSFALMLMMVLKLGVASCASLHRCLESQTKFCDVPFQKESESASREATFPSCTSVQKGKSCCELKIEQMKIGKRYLFQSNESNF